MSGNDDDDQGTTRRSTAETPLSQQQQPQRAPQRHESAEEDEIFFEWGQDHPGQEGPMSFSSDSSLGSDPPPPPPRPAPVIQASAPTENVRAAISGVASGNGRPPPSIRKTSSASASPPQQQQPPLPPSVAAPGHQNNDDDDDAAAAAAAAAAPPNTINHSKKSSTFDFLKSLRLANFEAVNASYRPEDSDSVSSSTSLIIPVQPGGGGDTPQQQRPNPQQTQQQQQQGPSRPPRLRTRGVSWDARVVGGGVDMNHIDPTETIKQSNLSALAAAAAAAAAAVPPHSPKSMSPKFLPVPPTRSPPRPHHSPVPPPVTVIPRPQRIQLNKSISKRRLELHDVLDANVELEAETYILESLDEKTNRTAPADREELFDQTILPQIPMTIAEDFVQHRKHVSNLSNDVQVLSSHHGGGGSSVGNTVNTVNSTTTCIPPKPSTTVETAFGLVLPAGQLHNHANAQGNQPNNQNRARLTRQASQKHRRQLTVNETIFGLTSALNAIDNANQGDAIMPDDSAMDIPPSKSNDPLNQTATLLFNRRRTRTEDSVGQPHHGRRQSNVITDIPEGLDASGELSVEENDDNKSIHQNNDGSSWDSVHYHSGMYKKNDETTSRDSPQDTDVEKGQTYSMNGNGPPRHGPQKALPPSNSKKRGKRYNPFRSLPYGRHIKEEWDVVEEFLQPRRSWFYYFVRIVLLYTMVPLIAIAFILFYAFDNPMIPIENMEVSWSYLLLFIVRNLVTLGLAKLAEVVVIDYLCLKSRFFINFSGSLCTLWVATSKGWPFLLSAWALFNFALMVGGHKFAKHWLFYQDFLQIFTDANPSGGLVYNKRWITLQGVAVAVGIIAGLKRLVLGLYLGKKSYANYAPQLAKLMDKMLLISEVAVLARQIEREAWEISLEKSNNHRKFLALPSKRQLSVFHFNKQQSQVQFDNLQSIMNSTNPDDDDALNDDGSRAATEKSGCTAGNLENGFRKIVENDQPLSPATKARITQLLGEWEDPKIEGSTHTESVSVSSILQFRRALTRMVTDYPFSRAFGRADSRALCVASAQDVFLRLLLKTPDSEGVLPFETLATLAVWDNEELDTEKVRRLIKLFRPERDGGLSLLDFARSVDKVYKEVRMLSATIENNSKIDRAVKNIFNIFFYSGLLVVILYVFGIDPLALFLSLSTVIVSFAFMIGRASSNYIEGLLLVLVQRPYGIGDHVNIASPVSESEYAGAQPWIVEDVNLFMTTFIMVVSNEKATISNGALAQTRIINKARSPKAKLFFTLKFGLDVPYKKIELFQECLVKFVDARPREWISLLAFRSTRVEADQGFVEYIVIVLHREPWQSVGVILQSRAVLQQFALELQKQMDMRYVSPSLPVDIKMRKGVVSHIKHESHADTDSASLRATPTLSPMVSEHEPKDVSASIFALFEGK